MAGPHSKQPPHDDDVAAGVMPGLVQVTRWSEETRAAGDRIEGVRRLLVVRQDRLGDLVLTLPTVAALRRTYPDARLGLMVRPSNVPLARCLTGIDEVLAFDPDPTRLRAALAGFEPDRVVCVSRGAQLPRAAWRARVRHRLGPGYRFYSPLWTRRVDERRRDGDRHELEYALSFAHRAGAAIGPTTFPLELPSAATAAAREWIVANHVEGPVIVHPGSGGSCPRWPLVSFLDLVERLAAGGRPVVLSLGPEDQALARALEGDALTGVPRFTGELDTLAALLRRSSLVVSNSTGPLHLAAALGTPTLALHAPWPSCGAARWGPYAPNGWALVAEHSDAAGWDRRARRRWAPSLMRGIPVTTVEHCVSTALDKGRPHLPERGQV